MTKYKKEQIKEIENILKHSVWGNVCRSCGGGGSENGDCNYKCSKCDGTGIVDWKYDFAAEKILDLLATTTKSSKEKGTGCSENTLLEAKMNTKFSKSSKEKEQLIGCDTLKGYKKIFGYTLKKGNLINTPTPSTNIKEIEKMNTHINTDLRLIENILLQVQNMENKVNEIIKVINLLIK